MNPTPRSAPGPRPPIFVAVLTDSHFWVPVAVLLLGLVLLALMHGQA